MRAICIPLTVIAVLLISGCIESAVEDIPDYHLEIKKMDIPEDYYFEMKKAYVDSPVELIRFAASIRPYAASFTVSEKVAFFEWYLMNRGFNVNFAYSDNFRDSGSEHTWLVLKNKLGENMAIEPSYTEMGAASISPTTPEYKSYQGKFANIYELSKNTGGSEQYAWWKKSSGQKLLSENILLHKKSEL